MYFEQMDVPFRSLEVLQAWFTSYVELGIEVNGCFRLFSQLDL
jgi:hypothetical protein